MNPLIVLMFLYPMTLQLRMCSTDRSTSTLTLVMVSDLLETLALSQSQSPLDLQPAHTVKLYLLQMGELLVVIIINM